MNKTGTNRTIINILLGFLAVAFIGSLILVAIVVHTTVRDLTVSYTGVGLNPFNPQGGSGDPLSADATPTLVRLPVEPMPWDGKSRVTLLVMGTDYRDWVEGESFPRSDTMMLVTLDPLTMQAGMLSIPRDLWVEIRGFGHNRINTAYMFGESSNVPGGGPQLAIQAVEDLVGVPIQYYAVVDFSTFERMIDEIGGIDVEVAQRLRLNPIGGKGFWLEPGTQHLDGPSALSYARIRKGAGDDFGRAERQQQVIMAIMDRVISLDLLPSLVSRAPVLYQEIASGLKTNLTLEQIVSLAWTGIQVPKENIQRGVIAPPNMVRFYTRPDGAQVLGQVPDQIRLLRDRIFVQTSSLTPDISQMKSGN
jgi:LCP family protein required for cell wall assembly